MRTCKIADCTSANNNCKDCNYKDSCDFPWVSDIWKKNQALLTPLMPGWVKPIFRENKIITITGTSDFCIFNVPKKSDTITIQDICIDESARGMGLSKEILNSLMSYYDRDILTKCVKDSTAEAFWSHIGEKISEEPSKQRTVCVYRVINPNKKQYKEVLF